MDNDCKCEFAYCCPVHQNGDGCVLKHNRIWVMNCAEWNQFNELANTTTRLEKKVLVSQDSGGD